MKIKIPLLTLASALFFFSSALAQTDSLIFVNGDIMLGEIKDLDKGILIIETDYSDNDFEIEWKGVQKIFTESNFLVTTSDGNRYNGTLMSTEEGKIMIRDADAGNIAYASEEIVFLKSVDKKFWSRVNASIDVGWSVTKAQNFRQLTVRSNVGYMADRWSADANYNTLNSTQDDTDPIRRTDGGLAFRQYLPNDWYLPVDLTFLSNTEQKIDLRTNAKIGFGKYVIHTNSSYWGFAAGASYVNEVFTEAERNSWEGYFGTELNLYDIGDFSLLTRVVGYPGITESGRWRADFVLDTKYDLPLDFYIKLGYTLNYDNQPAEGAPDADYVFSTGLGWEL